jgi:hypothetical protein
MKLARVLVVIVILCSSAGATSRGPIFKNKEYGITLHAPNGALLCPTQGNGAVHGASLLLGTQDVSLCRKSSGKRWIEIFAGYNVAEDSKTLHTFLNSECEYTSHYENEPDTACSPAPVGLSVNGLPGEAGRINHSDGMIEIIVVTQAGKPDPNFDASVPSINYDLSLHTNASHLDEDLAVFRAVLSTVKLSPRIH